MEPNGGTALPAGAGSGVATADRVVAGRYRIGPSLGRGGMGEVFVAYDLHLQRKVAVKVPRTAGALDPQALARFDREARAAALLSHPGIVAVHDVVHEDGTPFIVMELVHGQSLSARLCPGRPLDVKEAVAIAEAVAGALAYAHHMGVVHRDVKPANIMLTDGGGVKVLDFGLARYLSGSTPTDTIVPFGTAEYLAPEQIRGHPVDGRADVYALGCVVFEMLTGHPPFTGDPVAVVYRHLEDVPPAPSSADPMVPPVLDTIVLRCLSKDPNGRFASAGELEGELRRLGEALPASPASPFGRPVHRPALAAPVASTAPTRPVSGSPTAWLPPLVDGERAGRTRERGGPRRHPQLRRAALVASIALVAALVAVGTLAWARSHPAAAGPPKHSPKPRPLILHPPTGLAAKGECDGFIRFRATLSWIPTDSPRADGYAIYRADAAGDPYRLVGRVPGRSADGFVERELGASTSYRYRVRATFASKVGTASPTVTAATPLICMS